MGKMLLNSKKQCSSGQTEVGWLENLESLGFPRYTWAYDVKDVPLGLGEKMSLCSANRAAGQIVLAVYSGIYGREFENLPDLFYDFIYGHKAKCLGGEFHGYFSFTGGDEKRGFAGAYHYSSDTEGREFVGESIDDTWTPEGGLAVRFGTSEKVGLCIKGAKQTKKVETPVFLASTPCGGAYISKGQFKDNNYNWASDFTGLTVDANEWLNLCVHKDVIARYGDKAIRLEHNGCSGDSSQGWIMNNYNNWAITDGNYRKNYDKIHLCLKSEIKDAAKINVKRAIRSEVWNDVECEIGYSSKGSFTFRNTAVEKFAFAYWHNPYYDWTEINGHQNHRVQLCVKPIEFPIM